MKYMYLLVILGLMVGCNESSPEKGEENNQVDKAFPNKQEAVKSIHNLFNDYRLSFTYQEKSFEKRMELYTASYFDRYKNFMEMASSANKEAIQKMYIGDQLIVLGLRKSFPNQDIGKMEIEDVLRESEKNSNFSGMENAVLDHLVFSNDKQASAIMKSAKVANSITFSKENGHWKLNPLGDVLANKAKEEILTKKLNKTIEGYRQEILSSTYKDLDQLWVPHSK